MRVIENNYNAHTEYERNCPRCDSKFAFSFGDLKMDSVTLSHYVECPCCGFSISLNSEEVDSEETPTINTVQYPKDFYSFENGVPITADEIDKWIKECLTCLDKDNDYSCISSGNTVVIAYKSDEDSSEATVIVAKKYEETDVKIPRKNF